MQPEREADFARLPPLRELVYERLRDWIVEGRFAPGEHLVETELTAQLGVSRGPVREALQLLARDGWLDLRPRQGAFVRRPETAEIDSFFSVRALIECEAARQAAQRMAILGPGPDQGVETLTELLRDADTSLRREDHPALAEANLEFHSRVAQLSGNEALHQVWHFMSRRIRWYFAPLVAPRAAVAWEQHAAITKAIAEGDGDQAAEHARGHIEETRRAYNAL